MPYKLSIVSNAVSDVIRSAYRNDYDISISEWRLITVLAEGKALTPAELGLRTLMDKVTVSRAAIGLLKRDLIQKTAHPGDKRSHHLGLSKSGADLYAQVAPRALELEARVVEGFSQKERETLMAMLLRLEDAARSLRRA